MQTMEERRIRQLGTEKSAETCEVFGDIYAAQVAF
jgi:hypothetical protein